jgi:4-hydroxybenzoate polyprenyltransferase
LSRKPMLRFFERWLHGLYMYGAAGIAAFGWALCWLLGWDAGRWMPQWVLGALLVYNADRLSKDPADVFNVPLRTAGRRELRKVRLLLMVVAAGGLVIVPWIERDWRTLAAVIVGAPVCLSYSRALLGVRFKEVPVLKTFFAPTIVLCSVVGLPLLHGAAVPSGLRFWGSLAWAWAFLLFNMVVCDWRDREGDAAAGVVSLPMRLGDAGTRVLLMVLAAGCAGGAFGAAVWGPGPLRGAHGLLGVWTAIYLGALLRLLGRVRSERFYEWWVEGMLFVPGLALGPVALGWWAGVAV